MATGFGTWTDGLLKKVKKQSDPASANEAAATSQPTMASAPVQQPASTPQQQTTTLDPANSSRVTFRNPFKKRRSDPNPTTGIQDPTTFESPIRRPASMPQQTESSPNAQGGNTASPQSMETTETHPGRLALDRYYTEHSYAFPPTQKMVERIKEQHQHFKRILGFTVHPLIRRHLPPKDAAIADIDTGSGCYLYDLVGKGYFLTGYDIATDYHPYKTGYSFKVPLSSMHLKKRNLLEKFRPDDLEKYDMVHVQFLAPILFGHQWETAFNHVMDLVKPGGWVQWVDCDLSTSTNKDRVYISKPNMSKAAFLEMQAGITILEHFYEGDLFGGKNLRNIAENHLAVQHVVEEVYSTGQISDVRKEIDTLAVPAWGRLLGYLERIPDSGWDREKINRVVDEMTTESRDGTYIPLDIYVCLAQKKV